ncbi:hypothetical protein PTTG_26745, partial [Puccinia triticina 1-1 BBBD Race 1]
MRCAATPTNAGSHQTSDPICQTILCWAASGQTVPTLLPSLSLPTGLLARLPTASTPTTPSSRLQQTALKTQRMVAHQTPKQPPTTFVDWHPGAFFTKPDHKIALAHPPRAAHV